MKSGRGNESIIGEIIKINNLSKLAGELMNIHQRLYRDLKDVYDLFECIISQMRVGDYFFDPFYCHRECRFLKIEQEKETFCSQKTTCLLFGRILDQTVFEKSNKLRYKRVDLCQRLFPEKIQ